MGTLLKSLSDITSAAEMGNALQVPKELPGDNILLTVRTLIYKCMPESYSSPIYLADSLTCCFQTLLQNIGLSLSLC
jgi:hypothetical protein